MPLAPFTELERGCRCVCACLSCAAAAVVGRGIVISRPAQHQVKGIAGNSWTLRQKQTSTMHTRKPMPVQDCCTRETCHVPQGKCAADGVPISSSCAGTAMEPQERQRHGPWMCMCNGNHTTVCLHTTFRMVYRVAYIDEGLIGIEHPADSGFLPCFSSCNIAR